MPNNALDSLSSQMKVMADMAAGQLNSTSSLPAAGEPDFQDVLKKAVLSVNEAQNVAQAILDRAKALGIPTRTEPSLVAFLMELDLNAWVPPELFAAVAQVLAWAYEMDGKLNDTDVAQLKADVLGNKNTVDLASTAEKKAEA